MTRIRTVVRWAIPLVWAAGMLAARHFDPWTAIPIAATIMAIAVLATDGARIRELLRPSGRSAGLALVASLVMLAATYLLFPLFVRWSPAIGEKSAEIYSQFLSGRPLWMVIVFVVPLIAAEEVLWRGALQEGVPMKSQPGTVIVSATIYAAAHAPLGSALLVGVAFVCGIYWSGLRSFSGSLVPSLAAHLVWDLALIVFPLVSHS